MIAGRPPFYSTNRIKLFNLILYEELKFSSDFSFEAKVILTGLLNKDPDKRLGGGPERVQEIKNQNFFNGINWKDVFVKRK